MANAIGVRSATARRATSSTLVPDVGRVQRIGYFDRRPACATTRICRSGIARPRRAIRGFRAARLVALHAQPQAEEPVAPIKLPTLFLWAPRNRVLSDKYGRGLLQPDRQCENSSRSKGRTLPTPRTARGFARRVLAFAEAPAHAAATRETSLRRLPVIKSIISPSSRISPTWNSHSGSLRVNLPNKVVDRSPPATCSTAITTSGRRRRARLQHHGQRAPPDRDLHVVDRDRRAVGAARETKKARILVLGYPIGHRPDPLRLRQELATIDVISRGRLDMGFIRACPTNFRRRTRTRWRDGSLLGGARLPPQGDDDHDERSIGRVNTSTTGRSMSGAPGATAASAGLDHHRQQVAGAALGREGLCHATLGWGYATRPLYDAYRAGYLAKWKKPAGRPCRLSRPGRGCRQ